jgi:hypothetical protein
MLKPEGGDTERDRPVNTKTLVTSTATAVTEASTAVAATVDRGNTLTVLTVSADQSNTVAFAALTVPSAQGNTAADPGALTVTDTAARTAASTYRGNTVALAEHTADQGHTAADPGALAATDTAARTALAADRCNTVALAALTVSADQHGNAALNVDEILAGNAPAKWKSKTKVAVRRPVLWLNSKGSVQGGERIPYRCSLEWSLTAHRRRRRSTS